MSNVDNIKSACNNNERWWSTLTDECPITLEPLSTLPYPPFPLGSGAATTATKHDNDATRCSYFDGLALASYVVSRATFQNPLTREALTWDDCVRLDAYLEEYCYTTNNNGSTSPATSSSRRKISVKEAYGFREVVKVGRAATSAAAVHGSDASLSSADRLRAEALRSEAAAALRGLFVYGNDRQRVGSGAPRTTAAASWAGQGEMVPAAGFALHRPRIGDDGGSGSSANNHHGHREGYDGQGEVVFSEVEGLRIIDDDAAVARGSDDAAWREVQEAFPTLDGDDDDDDNYDSIADNPEQSILLQRARKVAEQTRRQEEEKKRIEERSRQILIEDAIKRRAERARQREEEKAKQAMAREVQIAEDEEVARARDEIGRWREEQWTMLAHMAEEAKQREYKKKRKEQKVAVVESNTTTFNQHDVLSQEEASKAAEERRAAKKAAKRRKERERQKAKKAAERKEAERLAKLKEEKKRRSGAKLKCAHCSKGILDGGFEKFGSFFCSTKCARAARC